MIDNEYHILSFSPAYEAEEVSADTETLAGQLVASGQLRINADHVRNFVHYSGSSFDKSFSLRQLADPKLVPETKQQIANSLPGMAGAEGVEEVHQRLLSECRKGGEVPLSREMQIARLLVQATHASVIQLILYERAHIYVSYSHAIGDLMAVHFWEKQGKSQGMQSIAGDGMAVYVSCGGDPFIEDDAQKQYVTDGFPALARMMVIAAQELGHYADMKRNVAGQCVGRHSVDLPECFAKQEVKEARQKDGQQVALLMQRARDLGIEALLAEEKAYRFYKQHRPMRAWWVKRALSKKQTAFRDRAGSEGLDFFFLFPEELYPESDDATSMLHCLRDMEANLTPRADVYRHQDPRVEEGIACVEALARVPQQVVKWGHVATAKAWPHLYRIYFEQVIPENVASVEAIRSHM